MIPSSHVGLIVTDDCTPVPRLLSSKRGNAGDYYVIVVSIHNLCLLLLAIHDPKRTKVQQSYGHPSVVC